MTEAIYPKDKILELYLNEVPYGGTSYGVEAASRKLFLQTHHRFGFSPMRFFGRLTAGTSTFSPYGTHPELGIQRQIDVLEKMKEQNYITSTQLKKARKKRLNSIKNRPQSCSAFRSIPKRSIDTKIRKKLWKKEDLK